MKKIAMALSVAMVLGSAVYAGKDVTVAESKVVPVLSPWYVGIGYSNLKMDRDCGTNIKYGDRPISLQSSDSDRANGILLLGGYNFNDYLALEGRWTVALEDFKFDDGSQISYYNAALYLKPHFEAGNLSVYGLLGYGYSHFDDDNDLIDDGDSDFQYGAGISYKVTENLSVFADYTVLYDEDNSDPFHLESSNPRVRITRDCDVKVDSINVGFTYRF